MLDLLNVSRDTVTGNRTVCLNWIHESFSLSLDFIKDGSLDRSDSVFTVDNFENVDENFEKETRFVWIDEPAAIEE